MKKYLSFILAAVIAFSLSACGGQSTTDDSNTQPKVSYDRNDPESILNAMASEFESATQSVTDDSTDVSNKIGDSYNSYDKNKTAVTDFYENSLEKAETLYDTVETISVDYFKYVAGQGLDDYKAWDDSMEDFYNAWDNGMDDFYKAWDRAYDDIYDKCDDLIGDASDTLEYAEYSDVWSKMYSEHSDAWSAMYSAYSDAWSKTYRDYSNIWSGFYSGEDDVDAILKAAAENAAQEGNKNQNDSQSDNTESQPSADAKPVDGAEHESGNFTYLIYSDGTIEITGYKGNDSSVTISSEIDGYDVSRIGDSAFENCTSMESITIWPDLIRIGSSAFRGCSSLENISVSSTVTEIEDSVFEGCTNLETATIWGDITSFGDSAFKGCSSLTSISIPSSTKMIGTSAFENCTALESVVFWGGEAIGDCAFKNCTSLSSISIPSETMTIGASAFEGCTSLESVIIWNDDIGIGANAFANCPKLKDAPSSTMGEVSPTTPGDSNEPIAGIRPEFKEAMDSYEAFYDEYCAFMKQYSANPTDLTLLGKYTDMLSRLADMDEKFEAWESEDLSNEELKYYLEVSNRITAKLLDAAS
ncbi:leucine-rich repeat domain-containing protein [Oscillospiraceae bacterium 50-16]